MKIATSRRARRERPIRVLHVITRMIVGGAQENTLLSCALASSPAFECELLSGIETGPEGELHSETRERGVRHHLEPSLVRAIHPGKDAVALVRLARFMRASRWDVVHTHSSKAGVLGRVAARQAGIPHVVHTVHGWGFTPGQAAPVFGLYVALERMCAPLTDVLVHVAERDRIEGLRQRIGRPDQYRLIRSGIEIDRFRDVRATRQDVRRTLGLPDEAFVVGSVGRFVPQKAPLDLVDAFARVARERADALLVVVGDGPLRAAVEGRIAEHGLSDRVRLTGIRRDVPELLRAFDVFALSSRWEGLPRVFPQAMAAGLPVVATDVSGASDAVVEGQTGFLVPAGDVSALGGSLARLAADPELRRRLGAAARLRVEEFSAARMVRQLEGVYIALVEGRAAPEAAPDEVPSRSGQAVTMSSSSHP